MKQWGNEKVIDGARFVPLVETAPFASAKPEGKILVIVSLEACSEQAQRSANQYRGLPYQAWLDSQ